MDSELEEEVQLTRSCDESREDVGREVVGYEAPASIREIHITQLNYGYVVGVGCQRFAIETSEKLIEKLNAYLKNPQDVEKNWTSNQVL